MNAREKIELLGEAAQGRMPSQERRALERFLGRLFRRSVSSAEREL